MRTDIGAFDARRQELARAGIMSVLETPCIQCDDTAIYVTLRDVQVARTQELCDWCYVDYGEDDRVVGIGIIGVATCLECSLIGKEY